MAAMGTSAFGPIAVIANPHAGGGRVGDELDRLGSELARRDLEFSLSVTDGPGDATRLAAAALEDGYRYLVAVGGDGTVQEVLNGVFRDGKPIADEPVLGVVAANSGCDLVRSFGLPGDVSAACGHLLGTNTYPFDVMKVRYTAADGSERVRYCHNLAEIGLGGEVAVRAARLPSWLGGARRFLAFWLGLARTRVASVAVEADRKEYRGPAFNVIVANAQFTSGGMRMSPRSFPGDGVLDALVFHGPRTDAYTLLPRIFRHGDHIPDPNIDELRAKIRVRVAAERPLPIVADGEILGTTPATFQVLPRSILLKL
jgi:diacylglycerol kinase (ATP)